MIKIDCKRLLNEFHPAEGTIPGQLLKRLNESGLLIRSATVTPPPPPPQEEKEEEGEFIPFDHEKFGAEPELKITIKESPSLVVQIRKEEHPEVFEHFVDSPTPPSSPPPQLFEDLPPPLGGPDPSWLDEVPPLAAVFPEEEEEKLVITMLDHGPIALIDDDDEEEEGITFEGIAAIFGNIEVNGDEISFTEETFQEEPEDVFATTETFQWKPSVIHFRVTCPACDIDETLVSFKRITMRKTVFEAEYRLTKMWSWVSDAFVRDDVEYVFVEFKPAFIPSDNVQIDDYHMTQERPSHKVFHGYSNIHQCGPRRNMIVSYPIDHHPPCFCF